MGHHRISHPKASRTELPHRIPHPVGHPPKRTLQHPKKSLPPEGESFMKSPPDPGPNTPQAGFAPQNYPPMRAGWGC
jgi:hypothetical protein